MKSLYLLLGVILCCISCKKEESYHPPKTFKKYYGGSQFESGGAFTQTSTGDFIIVGAKENANGDNYLYFLRTDKYGNLVIDKTLGESSEAGVAIKQIPNSEDFIVVTNNNSLTIYRLNANGEIIWHKKGSPSYSTHISAISVLGLLDNEFVVLGQESLLRFDYEGNRIDEPTDLWRDVFSKDFFYQIRSISTTNSGEVLVCGQRSKDGESELFISLLTNNGEVLWENGYKGQGFAFGYNAIADGDRVFATGLTALASQNARAELYALQINISDGSLICENSTSNGIESIGLGITSTKNGGFAVVGVSFLPLNIQEEQLEIYIVKLDSECNILWERLCGGTQDDTSSKIIETIDGGIAVCGSTNSLGYGDQDIYLIQLDENGNID